METTLGTLPVPQDRGFARGAPVLVLIRPEHLITDPVALDQSAITLEAEVTRIAYAGPASQVKLAVATQDLLIRRINTPGQQDLMLSDWLHIGLANATFPPHLIVLAGSDPTSKSRSARLSTSRRAEA
ncbi:TOBE domain-containing protein [Paenirhodobacter populi]|uniref:TOBE domain-containing protein n=1 Tax=Paenirhodobacter populi TaxID=2306993 RepID=UPI0013E2CB96|nr:TOBE domain-containing protein [Sinirhodobacter populi]